MGFKWKYVMKLGNQKFRNYLVSESTGLSSCIYSNVLKLNLHDLFPGSLSDCISEILGVCYWFIYLDSLSFDNHEQVDETSGGTINPANPTVIHLRGTSNSN